MRHFLSAYLYKVAVGAGMLVLVGVLSASLWLWQRDDGPGLALGANQGAPGQAEAVQGTGSLSASNPLEPSGTGQGFTAGDDATVSGTAELGAQQGGAAPGEAEAVQDTASLSDSTPLEPSGTGQGFAAGDDASVSDSAELEAQPGGAAPGQAEPVQDTASLSDSTPLEPGGTGQGFTAGDYATVSDSAELKFQQEQAPAPSGGTDVDASFGDSADLVVRDAEGNIKQQQTVR